MVRHADYLDGKCPSGDRPLYLSLLLIAFGIVVCSNYCTSKTYTRKAACVLAASYISAEERPVVPTNMSHTH